MKETKTIFNSFLVPFQCRYHLIRYIDSNYEDKPVVRPSCLYNGNLILVRRHVYIETTPADLSILNSCRTLHFPLDKVFIMVKITHWYVEPWFHLHFRHSINLSTLYQYVSILWNFDFESKQKQALKLVKVYTAFSTWLRIYIYTAVDWSWLVQVMAWRLFQCRQNEVRLFS